MLDVVWDMETGDPDDFLTLLLLCGHPGVQLKAVTVYPGSAHQIGLVRAALKWFELDIPVGAFDLEHPEPAVSPWHYEAYGNIPPSREAEHAPEILLRYCDLETTLITGAPLRNLGVALEQHDFMLGRLVAQGGFAGQGVVPPEKQLPKFEGLLTCPTFNLNGAPEAALQALYSQAIGVRRLVSKNVCHGVVYDEVLHAQVGKLKGESLSLELIWKGMQQYLGRRSSGSKKFHDPLAACCAIDESIGTWAEVELYREGDRWGSRPSPGSQTFIITGYDHEKFLSVLLEQ